VPRRRGRDGGKPRQETTQGLETPRTRRVPTPDHRGRRNPSMSEWDDWMGWGASVQLKQPRKPPDAPQASQHTFQLKRWPKDDRGSGLADRASRIGPRGSRLADRASRATPYGPRRTDHPARTKARAHPRPQAPSRLATTAPSGTGIGLRDGLRPTWAMATARCRTEVSHAPMSSNQA
jgi:hypothetical protein